MKIRGYISSRRINGESIPQRVQNLVIRDRCQYLGHDYVLSAAEYSQDESFFILEAILNEEDSSEALMFYSIQQLPYDDKTRLNLYIEILKKKKKIFFALEGSELNNYIDAKHIEEIWAVSKILPSCLNNNSWQETNSASKIFLNNEYK